MSGTLPARRAMEITTVDSPVGGLVVLRTSHFWRNQPGDTVLATVYGRNQEGLHVTIRLPSSTSTERCSG